MPLHRSLPHHSPSHRSRRAYTMIELLTVIAIIGIVSGIAVVGYKYVGTKAQERDTRTNLERLRNATGTLTVNKASEKAFFEITIPSIYIDPAAATATPPKFWDAVPAGSLDSLWYTNLILTRMRSNPEAKAILNDVPSDRQGNLYFRTADRLIVEQSNHDPKVAAVMPLDAWGKPILFVYDNWQVPQAGGLSVPRLSATGQPTGGLTDIYSDSGKVYWQMTPPVPVRDTAYGFTADRAKAPRNTYAKQGDALHSADRRPFWVSAGPDGKFETHDDNVYSFEN